MSNVSRKKVKVKFESPVKYFSNQRLFAAHKTSLVVLSFRCSHFLPRPPVVYSLFFSSNLELLSKDWICLPLA